MIKRTKSFFAALFRPPVRVVISPNEIVVESCKTGRKLKKQAPFSCSHLIVDRADILERTLSDAFVELVGSHWLFPDVLVEIQGRDMHEIEHGAIEQILSNAGASRVFWPKPSEYCSEMKMKQEIYARQIDR